MPGVNDRYYTRPPEGAHNVSMDYAFNPSAVITGNNPPTTGAWVPFSTDAQGNISVTVAGGVTVSGGSAPSAVAITGSPSVQIQSGSYNPNYTIITGSQFSIPVGARSYSVSVISGSAYLNGTGPIFAYSNINGGGYGGTWILGSAINVGATGTITAPCSVLIAYET